MIDNNDKLIEKIKNDKEDEVFTLRPQALDEFIGQGGLKDKLTIFMTASLQRSEPLDHTLFYGPPGLGKTTLAGIIAKEMKGNLRVTTGPALERAGDLAAILSNIQPNDVLFIDEIHRMSAHIEEILYPAMEDFSLSIIVGKGPLARSIRLSLPKFTLIGATTRLGLLTSPLRARFGIVEQLHLYSPDELTSIVKRGADVLGVNISDEAAVEIGLRSRGTPRVALRLLKRVRDVAEVKKVAIVERELSKFALDMLGVDSEGLDEGDRKFLMALVELFDGGPVGLSTLAAALNEDTQTIEDIYEPYLIQKGLLERTPRGRKATRNTWDYLGIPVSPHFVQYQQMQLLSEEEIECNK
ncbi:MAG: Holliday junction branch migration DNA helicase RuvB [Synergistaceae bacterium]|jgi:Holliday junction DNA helicase RuvB|nr:Holliday junction branch migration DNA helicase RuvB [Synergistaceae bacterium]MBP9975911.1 Holliday junction branch migration DNA helicase RuvB [Synergistaceae bacterium]MDD4751194.1 Holliday junction branch migration DNA helicase RuvB [Synergistaceae bacterium]MDD4838337.1 Holliday junction branch migration DNA helicase RuvB [Synergistaceae bacterium]PKL05405.1 MAG: Holliday junction branch migration DNA helicase RuvB [Synergistetes bacterium HGW-Synergistetes-1]